MITSKNTAPAAWLVLFAAAGTDRRLGAKFFGVSHMATLFGVVMLSHQMGGFLGAWLGGRVYEATGSHDAMWYVDIALALAAALIHVPIRETPVTLAALA